MESKPYTRNVIVGSLGGAALGAILALAYQRWTQDASEQQGIHRPAPGQRRALAPGQLVKIAIPGAAARS